MLFRSSFISNTNNLELHRECFTVHLYSTLRTTHDADCQPVPYLITRDHHNGRRTGYPMECWEDGYR